MGKKNQEQLIGATINSDSLIETHGFVCSANMSRWVIVIIETVRGQGRVQQVGGGAGPSYQPKLGSPLSTHTASTRTPEAGARGVNRVSRYFSQYSKAFSLLNGHLNTVAHNSPPEIETLVRNVNH